MKGSIQQRSDASRCPRPWDRLEAEEEEGGQLRSSRLCWGPAGMLGWEEGPAPGERSRLLYGGASSKATAGERRALGRMGSVITATGGERNSRLLEQREMPPVERALALAYPGQG